MILGANVQFLNAKWVLLFNQIQPITIFNPYLVHSSYSFPVNWSHIWAIHLFKAHQVFFYKAHQVMRGSTWSACQKCHSQGSEKGQQFFHFQIYALFIFLVICLGSIENLGIMASILPFHEKFGNNFDFIVSWLIFFANILMYLSSKIDEMLYNSVLLFNCAAAIIFFFGFMRCGSWFPAWVK